MKGRLKLRGSCRVDGPSEPNPKSHLLREMKAAYSILWVEPAADSLLGVSSRKMTWGLDRTPFRLSWTIFSLKVICCSVFLRCRYQPITLSWVKTAPSLLRPRVGQSRKDKAPHLFILCKDFL